MAKKVKPLIIVVLCLSILIMQIHPLFASASEDKPYIEVSVSSSGKALEYGYDDSNYIEFTLRNASEVDLLDMSFSLADEGGNSVNASSYFSSFSSGSDNHSDNNFKFNIAKGNAFVIRAYIRSGLAAGNYKFRIEYKAKYLADAEETESVSEKTTGSKIAFQVEQKSLVISAPDKTITAGDVIPEITVGELSASGLASGQSLSEVVEGLRNTGYLSEDGTSLADSRVAGTYTSENLLPELQLLNTNYAVTYNVGHLYISEPGNSEEDGEGQTPGDGSEDEVQPGDGEDPGDDQDPSNGENPGNGEDPGNGEAPGNGDDLGDGDDPGNNDNIPGDEDGQDNNDAEPEAPADIIPPTISVTSPDMAIVGDTFLAKGPGTLEFAMEDESGVAGLWYAFDSEDDNYVEVEEPEDAEATEATEVTTKGLVTINIPDAYEGILFYKAEDKVGNMSETFSIKIEQEEHEQAEKKDDVTPPEVTVSSEDMNLVGDTFICEEPGTLKFIVKDLPGAEDELISGAKGVAYSTDYEEGYISVNKDLAKLSLPKDYEGTIYFYAEDNAGNRSQVYCFKIEILIQIDSTPPIVNVTTDDMIQSGDAFINMGQGGSLIFEVTDPQISDSEPVSGPKNIEYKMGESTGELAIVEGRARLSIPDTYAGNLFFRASDNQGNKTALMCVKIIIREEENDDEMVKLTIPTGMQLFVNPHIKDHQIYSNDYTIFNHSGFPVNVTIRDMKEKIIDDDAKMSGVELVHELFFNLVNGDAKINIPVNGDQEGIIYSGNLVGDGDKNFMNFSFRGTVGEDSGKFWDDGDLELSFVYDIRRVEK